MMSFRIRLCFLIVDLFSVVAMAWHEPLLRGVKIQPKEVEKISNDVAIKARHDFVSQSKAREHIQTGCIRCADKDYSEPCPLGWEEIANGMCNPPAAYHGVCNKRQTFSEGAAIEKEEAEMLCGV